MSERERVLSGSERETTGGGLETDGSGPQSGGGGLETDGSGPQSGGGGLETGGGGLEGKTVHQIRENSAPLELSRRLGEPEWLGEWRVRADEIYRATPSPLRSAHLWRYTDPAVFEPTDDPFSKRDPKAAGPGLEATGPRLEAAGPRLDSAAIAAGVALYDLGTAAREAPDLLRAVLGTVIGPEFGRFEALNAAAFTEGWFLHIPRGVVLEAPIHVLETFDGPGPIFRRAAVLVEEGVSATIIHEFGGGASGTRQPVQVSAVVELRIGTGASVRHVTIQDLPRTTTLHLTQRAAVGRDATITPILASFGCALAKVDSGSLLEGTGSRSDLTGFVSAVGRQRFDHHTVHHHIARHTTSDLDFKTVLAGRSRSAYTGMIRIEETAEYSEAYQENRNLLLSDKSRADSIPELEILTEEVQCKHGATVGPLDPGHIFYLMSRGIPRDEAVRMIVEGHFESALQKLPEDLQERLRGILRARLQSS